MEISLGHLMAIVVSLALTIPVLLYLALSSRLRVPKIALFRLPEVRPPPVREPIDPQALEQASARRIARISRKPFIPERNIDEAALCQPEAGQVWDKTERDLEAAFAMLEADEIDIVSYENRVQSLWETLRGAEVQVRAIIPRDESTDHASSNLEEIIAAREAVEWCLRWAQDLKLRTLQPARSQTG